MTKNEDLKDCRDAFEVFMKEDGLPAKVPSTFNSERGIYTDLITQVRWAIWQAAWNTRPTVAPADGDAERALEALNRLIDKIPFNKNDPTDRRGFVDYCTVQAALQSTRKPPVPDYALPTSLFRTPDGNITGHGGIATFKQSSDIAPVPVDTIAVPREVLQGVREEVSHAVVYLKSCGHELQSEEDKRVNFKDPDHAMYICLSEALASLDAALSEGE